MAFERPPKFVVAQLVVAAAAVLLSAGCGVAPEDVTTRIERAAPRPYPGEGWTIALASALLVTAIILFAIGWWGYRNAENLVPKYLPEGSRDRRARSLRRGAVASLIGAVALVAITVAGLVR